MDSFESVAYEMHHQVSFGNGTNRDNGWWYVCRFRSAKVFTAFVSSLSSWQRKHGLVGGDFIVWLHCRHSECHDISTTGASVSYLCRAISTSTGASSDPSTRPDRDVVLLPIVRTILSLCPYLPGRVGITATDSASIDEKLREKRYLDRTRV